MKKEVQTVIQLIRNEQISNSKKIEWMEVLNIANKHKVLPIVYDGIAQNAPREYAQVCKERVESGIARQKKLWELYLKILNEAEKQNVKIVLPKGFPVAFQLYGNIEQRPSADIDLLVRPEDILKVCKILGKLGCFHRHNGSIDEIVKQFNSNEFDNFYEIKYLKYDTGELLWVEVKKATDAIPEEYIVDFIDTSVLLEIDGTKVWSLDDEHMFIHLCANAHKDTEGHEGICSNVFRLRNFYDIYLFLIKKGDKVNWLQVKEKAEKYEVMHKISWALHCLKSLFPDLCEEKAYTTSLEMFDEEPLYHYWGNKRGEVIDWEIPFVNRLFDNDLAKENYYKIIEMRRWSQENVNYNKQLKPDTKIVWNEIRENSGILFSIIKRKSQLFLCLKSKEISMGNLLQSNRLYFSIVGKMTDTQFDIDTIGNPVYSLCLYRDSEQMRVLEENFKTWTVNYGNYANADLNCGRVICPDEEGIYVIPLKIELDAKEDEVFAYNFWMDGPVLEDYYRHKWYRYALDQDLGIIKA